ncbi:Protein of uncharacterised function (DUF551) [Yersinia intermedia]|uniref:DUF551 domain-containing protein n=1 Tax=Yersinia intermedia TaxID=631 RepID=UPI0005E7463F|nr:DUF551 domain-containing protein [Yersinia intermedia]CNI92182.1 Protein of uncharacterised function (DUF551) [Yersinia intermedia]
MKDLDSFTVERLEEIIAEEGYSAMRTPKNDEVRALARIALAAKRAEPVYQYQSGVCTFDDIEWVWDDCDKGFYEQYAPTRRRIVYTTPRLNSPEVSDGWKLVPIEPTQNMVDAHISGMQLAGFSRAYRDMLAAAPEPQNQQQNIPEIIPQGWIKCSDQMPEDDQVVVIINSGHGFLYEAAVVTRRGPHFDLMDGLEASNYDGGAVVRLDMEATHWMQLPAAPEKENG